MGRQTLRIINKGDNNEDLLFLLSNVRSRENTLVFFLELFALSQTKKLNSEQYSVYKQEFLQKQKISTQQIKSIIEQTLQQCSLPQNQLRSFWIKLKSILRVSFQRAKSLGLLNEGLANLYAEMLSFIDSSYEACRPIREYFFIQKLIKRRTLETLIFTKDLYCTTNFADAQKIRSETFLKNKGHPLEIANSGSNLQPELPSLQEANSKLKQCSTRLRKREKGKSKPSTELKQTGVKSKNLRSLWQLERKLMDLMDVKIDSLVDKRKTLAQNEALLYESLFSKNISNHKIITKYAHYCTKMPQLLRSRKTQSKRNFSQSRLNRKITASKANQLLDSRPEESRQRLERPKTTKQSNLPARPK